jgi:hypothetical protein
MQLNSDAHGMRKPMIRIAVVELSIALQHCYCGLRVVRRKRPNYHVIAFL